MADDFHAGGSWIGMIMVDEVLLLTTLRGRNYIVSDHE